MKITETTIDHKSVLEMALVGLEIQRQRIEATIREVRAQLNDGHPDASTSTVNASAEPQATGKNRRFSAAARKRMAQAQKKRWRLLKAKKAEAAKPKRKKATAAPAPSAKKRHVTAKVAKEVTRKVVKAVPKPKAKKAVSRPKAKMVAPQTEKITANPTGTIEAPSIPVQPVTDTAPATA
jgi:hypothetical protein